MSTCAVSPIKTIHAEPMIEMKEENLSRSILLRSMTTDGIHENLVFVLKRLKSLSLVDLVFRKKSKYPENLGN